jgi:hypothetical protein
MRLVRAAVGYRLYHKRSEDISTCGGKLRTHMETHMNNVPDICTDGEHENSPREHLQLSFR